MDYELICHTNNAVYYDAYYVSEKAATKDGNLFMTQKRIDEYIIKNKQGNIIKRKVR